jgi:hypothetical protein
MVVQGKNIHFHPIAKIGGIITFLCSALGKIMQNEQ